MVVTLGALLADVPHSRPVGVSAYASDPALVERLGLQAPTYEGPTGIVGVLQSACAAAGMPAASLWAAVPHYVAVAPNPKGALAILRRLESLVGVTVDASDLESAAVDYERQVTRAVELDPEVQAFVERLERAADAEEGPPDLSQLPSGDVLAREFQRFLRQRAGSAGRLGNRRPRAPSASAAVRVPLRADTRSSRWRRPWCRRPPRSTRGAGHASASLVPFAQAAQRAGHDVLVAAPASAAAIVARAGLSARPGRRGAGEAVEAGSWNGVSWPEEVIRDVFVGLHAAHRAARDARGDRRVAARPDRAREHGVLLGARGRRHPRRAGRHPPGLAHRLHGLARGDRGRRAGRSRSSGCAKARCSPARRATRTRCTGTAPTSRAGAPRSSST